MNKAVLVTFSIGRSVVIRRHPGCIPVFDGWMHMALAAGITGLAGAVL